jgi:hypothetical protein
MRSDEALDAFIHDRVESTSLYHLRHKMVLLMTQCPWLTRKRMVLALIGCGWLTVPSFRALRTGT